MSKVQDVLFQSRARVKLLKFLFRNRDSFTVREISRRIQESPRVVSSEINKLIKIGLVDKK